MGHLFLFRGDLTRLHCDAWLLPTDRELNFTSSWDATIGLRKPPPPPADWSRDGCRTYPWKGWGKGPTPWLTWIGRRQDARDPSFYVAGAVQFARQAKGRLLALPLVGGGMGGGQEFQGALARALVDALLEEVPRLEADVALVCHDDHQLAACQQARQRHPFPLPAELLRHAQRLGQLATREQLSLFLGAGVSLGAGLPTWQKLLERLARGHVPWKALKGLDPLDQAEVLAARHGEGFKQAVADLLEAKHYSLTHGLLANLPTREVITQNYDQLFEMASEGARRPLSVIPGEPDAEARRWLLKMHGCVQQPQDIVLTRSDFLRYSASGRAALAGLVQAQLLTRHMLFVGFSLTDYNFHWIMDQVRQAQGRGGRFGTALSLGARTVYQELWERDLEMVNVASARELLIFLDCLLAHCGTATHHLLDPKFDDILSAPERRLRDRLVRLQEGTDAEMRALPAWKMLEEILHRLGA